MLTGGTTMGDSKALSIKGLNFQKGPDFRPKIRKPHRRFEAKQAVRLTIETPCLAGDGLTRLETEWRDLEARASASFFQSWSWIGCRAGERFDAPVLIRVEASGVTVGLALFNQSPLPFARRALWLHQTGRPAEDSVFIEHNGPLLARGYADVSRAILREAVRRGGVVVMGGVGAEVIEAVQGLGRVRLQSRREAPYAALAETDAAGWQAARGASTRSQLRRSRRRLEAVGPLSAHRAQSVPEALDFLEGLARLHQAAWTRREQPGAFAEPAFRRFHAALVARGVPRGEVALWRVSAGGRILGYLYNMEWRQSVLAYQSGFDMDAVAQTSPGLVAHALAIAAAAAAGMERYDFLAGDARYKRELGDASLPLYWIELAGPLQARGWFWVARDRLSRWRLR